MRTERVIAYIDGFNLYHGLCDAHLKSSRWLDLRAMCQSLLRPDQHLVLVRYFTSMVRNKPRAAKRQSVYIDALRSRGGIAVDFGHRLSKTLTCSRCGFVHSTSVEKKTDVNIAVRLLEDAYDDQFDVALVISADSDLAPPIEAVRRRFQDKTLLVAAPPKRWSSELKRVAHAAVKISPAVIRRNRLPDPVITSNGQQLRAPAGWLPSP